MSASANPFPLGIGVAGLGRAGTHHLERIRLRDDCRIVASYDECDEAFRKSDGLAGRFAASWGELLRDDAVELVLLATPPASHRVLAIEALAAGKHVLVESPLGLNLAEVDEILAAEQRAARSVIVAHTRRWDDDFRLVLQCLRSGAIGRPRSMKFVNWQLGPAGDFLRASRGGRPADRSASLRLEQGRLEQGRLEQGRLEQGRLEQGPFEQVRLSHWRDSQATGGGVLWEFGVYLFDQLLQFAGELPSRIDVERLGGRGPDAVDAGFLAVIRFPSGLTAHIEVDLASPVPLQTGWMLIGDEGGYAAGTRFTVTSEGEVVDVPLEPDNCHADEFYAAVVRHIRGGEPNPVSAEEARHGIELVEAAHRSAQRGRPVSIEG